MPDADNKTQAQIPELRAALDNIAQILRDFEDQPAILQIGRAKRAHQIATVALRYKP